MATWNQAFEDKPAPTDLINFGDNEIRATRFETRVRGEKEHAWANAGPDDGYHIEGSARAFLTSTNPANLNSAASPTSGGGAGLTQTNSRGRITFYDSTGGYWPRVYDNGWKNADVVSQTLTDTTTNSDTFSTTALMLKNTAGSGDFTVAVTTFSKGSWLIYATVRGTVKNEPGSLRTAAVQLLYSVGGPQFKLDQTTMALEPSHVGSYTLFGVVTAVSNLTVYTFRVRGMTSVGNMRWNEAQANPPAVEFDPPYTRMTVVVTRA